MKILKSFTKDAHLTRLIVFLAVIFVFFTIMKPHTFLAARTWSSMAVQFPEFGLMALGVMVCMITSGIDLSVVGVANMTSIGAAVIMLNMAPKGSSTNAGAAILVAVLFSLVVGALAGVLNGLLVAKVNIPPILATLGTLELFSGIAIIITEGKPVSGLPALYGDIFAGRVFGIPVVLIIFILATALIAFFMNMTGYGTKLKMLGTNAKAARLSGLNVTSLLVRTYALSGVYAALAGLVMLANYNSAKADYGSTYTLLTVLIVVLGGVNPDGGWGRVSGVVLAIVILQVLSSGLNMFPNISNFYRPLIWGGVLLAVMTANYFLSKRPTRAPKHVAIKS
jgi:simple sugar transport system permease protein